MENCVFVKNVGQKIYEKNCLVMRKFRVDEENE